MYWTFPSDCLRWQADIKEMVLAAKMSASNLVPRMFTLPSLNPFKAFLVAQFVKNLPAIQETGSG